MHFLKKYALSTGSKINKPFIIKKFFPIPAEKYITIENNSAASPKHYDYFQDVIDFLKEKLEKNGYRIVQLGNKDDKSLSNAINLQGKTDINQTAFIIDNSKLHIGNDGFFCHMANSFGTPLVALYGISSPEISGPFWPNNSQICLTPENWKPSFNSNESPKQINNISINKIVSAVNKILFKEDDMSFETLNIGHQYGKLLLEALPDQILPKNLYADQLLNIRYDYYDKISDIEYNAILNNLNMRPCCLITDKGMNLQPFLQFKDKLIHVFYDITKNLNMDFLNHMKVLNIKNTLIFKLDKNNQDILDTRKLDLIDYPENIEIVREQKLELQNSDNILYKSSKLLFANNKAYLSRAAQLEDKFVEDFQNIRTQSFNELKYKEIFISEDSRFCLLFKTT